MSFRRFCVCELVAQSWQKHMLRMHHAFATVLQHAWPQHTLHTGYTYEHAWPVTTALKQLFLSAANRSCSLFQPLH